MVYLTRLLRFLFFLPSSQCTVYSSAQRRKMHCFKGFQRKAVVLVLSDEDWKKRLETRKEKEGEIVPEYVLLEMRGF